MTRRKKAYLKRSVPVFGNCLLGSTLSRLLVHARHTGRFYEADSYPRTLTKQAVSRSRRQRQMRSVEPMLQQMGLSGSSSITQCSVEGLGTKGHARQSQSCQSTRNIGTGVGQQHTTSRFIRTKMIYYVIGFPSANSCLIGGWPPVL